MTWVLLLMLLIPLIVCSLNAILNRIPGTHPHATPFIAGLIANIVCVPAYVVLHLTLFGAAPAPLIAGVLFILIYLNCNIFFNWFVFAVSDASMHIRIMMQIDELGAATPAQIVGRYNKSTIIAYRIPRLVAVKQLRVQDGRLLINSRSVIYCAAVCRLVRRLLGIPVRPENADHYSS